MTDNPISEPTVTAPNNFYAIGARINTDQLRAWMNNELARYEEADVLWLGKNVIS